MQYWCIIECRVVVQKVKISVQFVSVQFEWQKIDTLEWKTKWNMSKTKYSNWPFLEIEMYVAWSLEFNWPVRLLRCGKLLFIQTATTSSHLIAIRDRHRTNRRMLCDCDGMRVQSERTKQKNVWKWKKDKLSWCKRTSWSDAEQRISR